MLEVESMTTIASVGTQTVESLDPQSNSPSHLQDKQLNGAALPTSKSWGGYLAGIARSSGISTAMLGFGLGLSGMAGLDDKKADGDVMISREALEAAKVPGAQASTDNGGPLVGVELLFADGTKEIASGIGYNTEGGEGRTYTAGHIRYGRPAGTVFSVITGIDLNNPTGRYEVIGYETAPGYAGNSTLGSAMDVELWYLKAALLKADGGLVGNITFDVGDLPVGSTLNSAGYGRIGVLDQQYLGQDLLARGWTSNLANGPTLLGANNSLYKTALMNEDDAGSGKADEGDSGGPRFRISAEGDFLIRGMTTQGGTSISSINDQYLDMLTPSFQTFHSTFGVNSFTAVPEPPASLLALLGMGALALYRSFRARLRGAAKN